MRETLPDRDKRPPAFAHVEDWDAYLDGVDLEELVEQNSHMVDEDPARRNRKRMTGVTKTELDDALSAALAFNFGGGDG